MSNLGIVTAFTPHAVLGAEAPTPEQIAKIKSKFTLYAGLGILLGSLATGMITYFAFHTAGVKKRWQPAAVVAGGTAVMGGVSVLVMRGALTSPEPIKPLALVWGMR